MSASPLNSALLEYPRVLDDFPQMITALDRGEHVNVGSIRDAGFRDALMLVFQHLPVEMEPGRGFYKSKGVKSIGGFLLMDLLDQKAIKQPSNLSTEQISLGPLHFLSLLRDHPSKRENVVSLMRKLLKRKSLAYPHDFGKFVDSDVAEKVRRTLLAFGAYEGGDDNDNICLPEKKSDKVHIAFREMVKCLNQVFDKEPSKASSSSGSKSSKHNNKTKGGGETKDSDEDDENSEESDSGESDGEREEAAPSSATVGPARPTSVQMKVSREMSKSYIRDEVDLDDDDFGPLPASAAAAAALTAKMKADATTRASNSHSLPLGFEGAIPTATPLNDTVGEYNKKRKTGDREEWMLTPGDNSGIAAMNQVFDEDGMVKLNNKAGKFNTSKAASSAARDLQEKKRSSNPNPADVAAEAMLREYNEMRGPSLMDQHLAEMDAKKAVKKAKGSKRDGFDYERDIVNGRNGTNSNARDELVKEASTLSSRFDRSVQR